MDARLLAVFCGFLLGLALIVVYATSPVRAGGACATTPRAPVAPQFSTPRFVPVPDDTVRLV